MHTRESAGLAGGLLGIALLTALGAEDRWPLVASPLSARTYPTDSAAVVPNDNRTPAGRWRGDTLTLHLVARGGDWQPEGAQGPRVPIFAFAEDTGAPRIPGPLIRVPVGTVVDLTVHNRLARPLRLFGLNDWPSERPDSILLAPSEERHLRLQARAAGTYLYWGRTLADSFAFGVLEDGQLSGAIVVDSVPRGRRAEADRVFIIGLWKARETPSGTPIEEREETLVLNGLAWPHTERMSLTVGDTARWRVINATRRGHPMHLHGFYFRVDARGTAARDTLYAPSAQRLVVTERLLPGTSMALSWAPHTPGNWLFHCHLVEHISGRVDLASRPALSADGHADGNHALEGMSGLVLGISVRPRPGAAAPAPTPPRRTFRVIVTQRANVFDAASAFSFVRQEGPVEPAADSVRIPGSTLRLVRGEPTAITVVNRAREPVSVHWHGIELESYFDGVSGWSGAGDRVAPQIAPGDSFVVRMTPPRAGTFMYHTHFNETRQLGGGLFAPLIVDAPASPPDTARERLLILGSAGPAPHALPSLNGKITPAPLELRAGATYRFRVISIAPNDNKALRLLAGTVLQRWRPVAKDGADLPPQQSVPQPARLVMGTGETWDLEFTAPLAGDLTLEIVTTGRAGLPPVTTHVPVRVRLAGH